MDGLDALLGRNGLLPHGFCISNSPFLLWSMVVADSLIALAYFSIPVAIVTFLRRRQSPAFPRLAWLFGAFIFACGVTHVMDVWTLWLPDYALQTLAKAVTAVVSVITAAVLWRLIPVAVQIPSVAQLRGVIARLEAEVAQRKSAEEQLAEVQQALAATLSGIGAGFISTDASGRVNRINGAAQQLLGWPEALALGASVYEVFNREGRPADYLQRNPVEVVVEHGYTVEERLQFVAIARDGRRTPVELRASLTHSSTGAVSGMALVFRDLTQIKRAEAESARLAAIVESSNDAIIGKNLQGTITSWNAAAQRVFGHEAQAIIGQPVQLLIPPALQGQEMDILRRLALGEQVPAFETVRLHRDGREIQVALSISPILDSQGHVIGASKFARDITLQKQAEAALRASEQQAQKARLAALRLEAENRQIQTASRMKSQFLANMSHELRTPLNAVIGFADLLRGNVVPADSPKQGEYLGHIATSARHLLTLINDVLDLSKIESGKTEFYPEALHLPTLVAEVRGVLKADAMKKQIALQVDIAAEVEQLRLDPARLKQVLFNYLSNAIKFTPAGGRVQLRARPEGERQVRIEVEDNGIGIAAADLPRLFTDFQQLDGGYDKAHQGTGLGLALTRRLVQAQGGSVGVLSTPGRGSTFHLVLDREQRTALEPVDPAAESASHGHSRLLLLAGDPSQQALSDAGFRVDTAGDTAAGEALAQGRRYDTIMVDLDPAGAEPLSLLDRIRQPGPNQGARVLSLGLGLPAAHGGHASFPVADLLFKPLRVEQVTRVLQPYSERRPEPARVLVVDDDPLARGLMQATLAALGIEPVCFADGRQALDELPLHRPDAMVLDLMMPDFDGFAVMDALQALPPWRDLPVFIWTSMTLTEPELRALRGTAAAILHKGGGSLQPLLDRLAKLQVQRRTTEEGA